MRILHYALGFPPYRTGGMTKFCMDIMRQQKQLGHEIALMWPGQIKLYSKSVYIKHREDNSGILSFEIINPLPISYDEGITQIEAFTANCNKKVFFEFLEKYQPNVIHIHSIMGLYREFVEVANTLGIPTIFSVHDFFTVCPKVTMFHNDAICKTASDCLECPQCNLTALSINKIMILQSHLYRTFKDSALVKKLRKNHRDQYLSGKSGEEVEFFVSASRTASDYKSLREYYGSMIAMIDTVHYNSAVTKTVFERFFTVKNSQVISITHADIRDNRRIKEFTHSLRMTYLGPQGGGKGFFLLKAALDELWLKDKTFTINIYFTPTEMAPYMKVHGRYSYSDMENIFNETDVVITPSVWYETFGYTVLEAMSYGVPVIISGNVGAKDVVPDGCGVIVDDINKDNLVDTIQQLTPERLKAMNQNIVNSAEIMTLEKMTRNIMETCYK